MIDKWGALKESDTDCAFFQYFFTFQEIKGKKLNSLAKKFKLSLREPFKVKQKYPPEEIYNFVKMNFVAPAGGT